MGLVDIAAVMYISVGFADVLDVVSAAAHIAVHLRHSASRGNTKSLLVRISIILSQMGLSWYSRLLAVLGVWSTVAVRDWGGRTGHGGVIRYALAIAIVASPVFLLCDQGPSSDGTEFLIFVLVGFVLVVLLLPESSLAVAGGVVVRGAGAVALLPLACAAEDDFESCGN